MQVGEVIRGMLGERGASERATSLELGRSPYYLHSVGAPTRSPALGTVADVADVLGYDLAIVDRTTGEELGRVVPPRRTGD